MTATSLEAFEQSVRNDPEPPPGTSLALQALWHDRKGDWNQAHAFAQNDRSLSGSWVHAYLHRKEGDASNAGYWYSRAGRPPASGGLDEEWRTIAAELLLR